LAAEVEYWASAAVEALLEAELLLEEEALTVVTNVLSFSSLTTVMNPSPFIHPSASNTCSRKSALDGSRKFRNASTPAGSYPLGVGPLQAAPYLAIELL
jgi:hypothetical protein